jgi:hypothetical protein
MLFLQPDRATTKAFLRKRKIQALEALQDTGRWPFGQTNIS